MTETTISTEKILAMTLAKLSEQCPDTDYIEQLRKTAEMMREFECEEESDSEDIEDFDTLCEKYSMLEDELDPSYYDIEEAISRIFEMCDTLADAKEVMAHMRVARELRFVWYPFPGEISR